MGQLKLMVLALNVKVLEKYMLDHFKTSKNVGNSLKRRICYVIFIRVYEPSNICKSL